MNARVQTRVQKWGNSLALRIPKPLAVAARISEGSLVHIAVDGDKLSVTAIAPRKYTLEGLLAGVTAENVHSEVSTGHAVGNEIW